MKVDRATAIDWANEALNFPGFTLKMRNLAAAHLEVVAELEAEREVREEERHALIVAGRKWQEQTEAAEAKLEKLRELAKVVACGKDNGIDGAWETFRDNALRSALKAIALEE